MGGCHVPFLRQPGGIANTGLEGSDLSSFLVHQSDEFFAGATDMFRQRNGGVVGGPEHHAVKQLVNGQPLAGLELDGWTGGEVASTRTVTISSSLVRFQHNQSGDDFCRACGWHRQDFVVLPEYFAAARFQQNGRLSGQFEFRGAGGRAHSAATHVKTQASSIVRKLGNFSTALIFMGIRNLFQSCTDLINMVVT